MAKWSRNLKKCSLSRSWCHSLGWKMTKGRTLSWCKGWQNTPRCPQKKEWGKFRICSRSLVEPPRTICSPLRLTKWVSRDLFYLNQLLSLEATEPRYPREANWISSRNCTGQSSWTDGFLPTPVWMTMTIDKPTIWFNCSFRQERRSASWSTNHDS